MRRLAITCVLCLLFTFALTACKDGTADADAADTDYTGMLTDLSGMSGTSDTQTSDEDDLGFTLSNDDPNFTGLDLNNEPGESEPVTVSSEPVYIERGGYAYELDPQTLQIIDVPLDINTHLPISQEAEPESVVSDTPDVEDEPTPSIEVTPEPIITPIPSTVSTPTETTKYPNTGIFLEDD